MPVLQPLEIRNAQNQAIRGEIDFPDGCNSDTPCLIINNSFGTSYQIFYSLQDFFVRSGIACVLFDFRGGSLQGSSDGAFHEMSVLSEMEDLITVTEYIKNSYGFKNLFLLGVSQGGFVSAMVAARLKKEIRGLMLWYPAFIIPDDARAILGIDGEVREVSPALHAPIGKVYLEDAARLDYQKEIQDYDGPVLIIHGEDDPIVPVAYAHQAREIYRNARLTIFEEQGHGFSPRHNAQAIRECVSFIKECIGNAK